MIRKQDLKLAREVIDSDDIVDDLFDEVKDEILQVCERELPQMSSLWTI